MHDTTSNPNRRIPRRGVLQGAAAIALASALPTRAADGPPVTLVVPFPPGGASDIGARLVAPDLARELGRQVLVENVSGASGAIGVQKVLRAAADGRTLLYGGLSEALLNPMVNPDVPFKVEDLLPLGLTGLTGVGLITRPDFPASDIDGFIDFARRNPGRINFGSSGPGSYPHVMMEIIKARTGAFMVHIPYRGGAPVMNDLMGGQLDAAVIAIPALLGPLKTGRIKVLGIASNQRSALLKDTPTTTESRSLRELTMEVWSMVYARAGTPDAVARALNAAIARAASTPDFQGRLARLGAYLPAALTLEGSRQFVSQQQSLYRQAVQRIRGG